MKSCTGFLFAYLNSTHSKGQYQGHAQFDDENFENGHTFKNIVIAVKYKLSIDLSTIDIDPL